MSVASMNKTAKTEMLLFAGMLDQKTPVLSPERPQAAPAASDAF